MKSKGQATVKEMERSWREKTKQEKNGRDKEVQDKVSEKKRPRTSIQKHALIGTHGLALGLASDSSLEVKEEWPLLLTTSNTKNKKQHKTQTTKTEGRNKQASKGGCFCCCLCCCGRCLASRRAKITGKCVRGPTNHTITKQAGHVLLNTHTAQKRKVQ